MNASSLGTSWQGRITGKGCGHFYNPNLNEKSLLKYRFRATEEGGISSATAVMVVGRNGYGMSARHCKDICWY